MNPVVTQDHFDPAFDVSQVTGFNITIKMGGNLTLVLTDDNGALNGIHAIAYLNNVAAGNVKTFPMSSSSTNMTVADVLADCNAWPVNIPDMYLGMADVKLYSGDNSMVEYTIEFPSGQHAIQSVKMLECIRMTGLDATFTARGSTTTATPVTTGVPAPTPATTALPAPDLSPVQYGVDSSGNPMIWHPREIVLPGSPQRWADYQLMRALRDMTIACPSKPMYAIAGGPPGGGKSMLFRAAFGLGVRTNAITSDHEKPDLLGATEYGSDAKGNITREFVMEQFLAAFTHRHDSQCEQNCPLATYVGEEWNFLSPTLGSTVHPGLDATGRITYQGQVFERSPDFWAGFTMNEDAVGGFITDAFWSRVALAFEWQPSYSVAERSGVRADLVEFARNLAAKRRNVADAGDLELPSIRTLLAAEQAWQLLGPGAAWSVIVNATTDGQSQETWLEEASNRAGDEIAKFLTNAGTGAKPGRIVVNGD